MGLGEGLAAPRYKWKRIAPMTPENGNASGPILESALDLDPARRAFFLDEACADRGSSRRAQKSVAPSGGSHLIGVCLRFGRAVRGKASSDIDLLVVGEVGFNEVVSTLGEAEKRLAREINPTVYPVKEFRAKQKANNHLLSTVIRHEKLFVVGDEHELRRLG